MRIDYKIEEYSDENARVVERLNVEAESGWELVGVAPAAGQPKQASHLCARFIFKRSSLAVPKSEE